MNSNNSLNFNPNPSINDSQAINSQSEVQPTTSKPQIGSFTLGGRTFKYKVIHAASNLNAADLEKLEAKIRDTLQYTENQIGQHLNKAVISKKGITFKAKDHDDPKRIDNKDVQNNFKALENIIKGAEKTTSVAQEHLVEKEKNKTSAPAQQSSAQPQQESPTILLISSSPKSSSAPKQPPPKTEESGTRFVDTLKNVKRTLNTWFSFYDNTNQMISTTDEPPPQTRPRAPHTPGTGPSSSSKPSSKNEALPDDAPFLLSNMKKPATANTKPIVTKPSEPQPISDETLDEVLTKLRESGHPDGELARKEFREKMSHLDDDHASRILQQVQGSKIRQENEKATRDRIWNEYESLSNEDLTKEIKILEKNRASGSPDINMRITIATEVLLAAKNPKKAKEAVQIQPDILKPTSNEVPAPVIESQPELVVNSEEAAAQTPLQPDSQPDAQNEIPLAPPFIPTPPPLIPTTSPKGKILKKPIETLPKNSRADFLSSIQKGSKLKKASERSISPLKPTEKSASAVPDINTAFQKMQAQVAKNAADKSQAEKDAIAETDDKAAEKKPEEENPDTWETL